MKHLSRRDLLVGASLLALSRNAEAGINNPGSIISSGPVAPTGKINLGLTGPSRQQNALPFINLWKGCDPTIQITVAGTTYRTDTPAGTSAFGQPSAFPTYFDANGELISPCAAGTTLITRQLFQLSTITGSNVPGQYPPQFAGQQFTIDWTGATDWTISVNDGARGTAMGSGTSSFTFTWPTTYGFPTGSNVLVYVNMVPGTLANPPKNIRIYKTNYAVGGKTGAQRLALGEVIDPDYAAQVISGCGTFRVMDWMTTINNDVTNSYANIPTEASNFWGIIGSGASGIRGIPLSVIVKTAKLTNKNPHICIPSAMMSQNYKSFASITRATSPVITTLGPHTFSNGDQILLNSLSLFVLINPASYATSTFTTSAPHGMVNGYPLKLGTTNGQAFDSSTYPTGVSKNVCYYACNVTATTFQIASTQANALAGTNIALSGSVLGPIASLGSITPGSGYVDGTYTAVPLTGGPGQGAGTGGNAQATIVVSGGVVTSVTITNTGVTNGSGLVLYAPGNSLSALAANLGGSGSGFSVPVATVKLDLYLDMNFNQYAVSNSNQSAGTFQITGPGSDTTILISGGLAGGFGMSPYDITYINTQVGLLAGYFRDNLPAPFCPTYEVDNEQWNFGTRVFFNFNGQSRAKFGDSAYQVMAYMNGVFGQAIKTAYAGDRSRYKMLFCGNQMFGDLFGAGLQAGWLKYVADNPGVVATDLFDYLLGNTYIGNVSYNNNGTPQVCTFGTNTIAYGIAKAGLPVKLSTTGALPVGLTAGTLGTAPATVASSQILGTISGNVLTVLVNLGDGNTAGTILAGSTIALPGIIPANTTIAAFGTGGTTGTGGSGTYQISNSVTIATPAVIWCGTPYVPGTGQIYWLVGTGPNFGLAITPGGSPVSFTGPGTGTHSATRCPCDVISFLVNQSLALNISTPGTYPTPYTYYNQAISDDCFDARWTAGQSNLDPLGLNFDYCIQAAINSFKYYYTTYLAPGKLLAGLGQTSYEGGDNNPPQNSISSTTNGFLLMCDPTWQAMFYNSHYSQGNADNLSQMDVGCRTVTGGFYKSSQFLDSNPFGVNAQGGIYGSKEYIGDNNLRWQGVVSVNNS